MALTLGELIKQLEIRPQDEMVVFDFGQFHPGGLDSWRGIYAELALEYVESDYEHEPPKVSAFLAACREAVSKTYTGYKGGEYTMSERTKIHVANYGNSGHTALVGVCPCSYMTVLRTEFDE